MVTTQEKKPVAEAKTDYIPSCPLCRNPKYEIRRRGIREDPERPVYKCAQCFLEYIQPVHGDLYSYYRDDYRKHYSCAVGQPLSPAEEFKVMRPLMNEARLRTFRANVPKGAIVLDVGCSSGFFLDAIRDDYAVYGNEWNPEMAAYVRDELGIPCDESRLEDAFPGRQFTCITASNVIEHVADPIAWLKVVKERTIGGGWVYLETPNLDNMLVSVYDVPAYRDIWYREPHLLYFNMDNFSSLLGVMGYEAHVGLQEKYSLRNHLQWIMTGEPDPDALAAAIPLQPVLDAHPASNVINRWFISLEREYKRIMDTTRATSHLIAVGRKREI